MSLTNTEDYKGPIAIAQNKFVVKDLQLYLDEKEPEYLNDLLGCVLYDALIVDLALPVIGEPTEQRFKDIYNKFCIDDNSCIGRNESRGILAMLRSFMFMEYTRDQPITNSSTGNSTSTGVASVPTSNPSSSMTRQYNKGVKDYQNIQYYICQNSDVYPEYNGIEKEFIGII